MPITKSAKKSLKVSKTKRQQNEKTKIKLSKALKQVDAENVNKAVSAIDKAAKTGVIHQNKAARMKSALSKKFSTPKTAEKKAESKTVKKSETAKPKVKSTTTKKTVKKAK